MDPCAEMPLPEGGATLRGLAHALLAHSTRADVRALVALNLRILGRPGIVRGAFEKGLERTKRKQIAE